MLVGDYSPHPLDTSIRAFFDELGVKLEAASLVIDQPRVSEDADDDDDDDGSTNDDDAPVALSPPPLLSSSGVATPQSVRMLWCGGETVGCHCVIVSLNIVMFRLFFSCLFNKNSQKNVFTDFDQQR